MDFKYPYTDFHELNLDWFLAEFKKLTKAWLQVQQDWADEQQAYQDLHDYVENYFANLDLYQEVHDILWSPEMQGNIQIILSNLTTNMLPSVVADQITNVVATQLSTVVALQLPAVVADKLPAALPAAVAGEAAAWLADHVDPDTGYVIDNTLTISLAAADAKVTGDNIRAAKATINENFITKGNLVQGGFSSANGINNDNTRIRLYMPIPVPKNTKLVFDIGSLYTLIWELSSDSTAGGNVIVTSVTWNQLETYVTQNDCWLMIAFANAANPGDATTIVPADFTDKKISIIPYGYAEINEYLRTQENTEVEQGGYSGSVGLTSDTLRIRATNVFFASKNTRIQFSIGSLYAMVWELSSDSTAGGNVITSKSWSQDTEYTVQNDCWIMLAFANGADYGQSTTITPADFAGYYWRYIYTYIPEEVDLAHEFSKYHFLNDSTVQNRIADYAAHIDGKHVIESFMFFTDSHWLNDSDWQKEVSDALVDIGGVYNTAPVDFCIYGGDAVTGDAPGAMMTSQEAIYFLSMQDRMCRSVFGNDQFLPLAGNHDYNYIAQDLLTEDDMVNAMFRKWGKAYYSYKADQTTVYCLNTGLNRRNNGQGDYAVQMDAYKWEQIDWLAKALKADDPAHALITMHIIINNAVLTPFCLYVEASKVCAAFNNHTTITENGITYDFTACTGKVEMFLGGHLHTDDTYGIEYGINDGIAYVVRATAKTTPFPTFDLVLCDWTNKTAFFKRFGTGSDLLLDLTTGTPI